MPPSTPEDKWDDTFSAERGRTVTLRDSQGTLYCVQAHFLAEISPVFKDMFSCVSANADPIDADFDSRWTKLLLLYLTRSPHADTDFMTIFDSCPPHAVARLHLWCQKYECSSLQQVVERHLQQRTFSPRTAHSSYKMAAFFSVAGKDMNEHLLRIGCGALQGYLDTRCESPMKLVEKCEKSLTEGWWGTLSNSVLEYKLVKASTIWECFSKRMEREGPPTKPAKRARTTP